MLELKNATKRFTDGEVVNALDGVSITVERGEFVGIIGPSGCGKSTLLYTLGLLDSTDEGEYRIGDQLADELTRKQRAKLRNKKFGFVFQSFNLLARTSSYDNVILPLLYGQTAGAATKTQASLERVGLWNKRKNWPNQLSGGQQQRVAIARALVNEPEIILADEPTGNLDSKSGDEIMHIFQKLNKEGKTIIMITHEVDIDRHAKKTVRIKDG